MMKTAASFSQSIWLRYQCDLAPIKLLRPAHSVLSERRSLARLPTREVVTMASSSPAPAKQQRIQQFKNLQGSDFQHPLDRDNCAMLRSLPGLDLLARNLLGPVAEQVLLLENISTSVLVGPDQLSSLHSLLVQAAGTLHMEAPDLYVRQHPVPNAYTLAYSGRKPFIVIHTALLELLTPAEVQAVIAHELGHLKCDHGVWLTMGNVLASGTLTILPLLTGTVEDALIRWLRAAELTCDRAALLVAQDPRIVVSVLMKLAGGSPSFAGELNVDAFLRQARSYDEASSSPLGWYLRTAQTKSLSHPLPVLRAREIDKWAQSPQYRSLLLRHQPRPSLDFAAGAGAA
eukprot:jgi/Botrbrau1/16166/Bobra.0272s0003.2